MSYANRVIPKKKPPPPPPKPEPVVIKAAPIPEPEPESSPVGLIVGIIVGLLIIAIIIVVVIYLKKKKDPKDRQVANTGRNDDTVPIVAAVGMSKEERRPDDLADDKSRDANATVVNGQRDNMTSMSIRRGTVDEEANVNTNKPLKNSES